MGSEGPPSVTIHVTGFKKFHGVYENPTETINSPTPVNPSSACFRIWMLEIRGMLHLPALFTGCIGGLYILGMYISINASGNIR